MSPGCSPAPTQPSTPAILSRAGRAAGRSALRQPGNSRVRDLAYTPRCLGRGGAGHDRPQVSRRAIDASGWGGADLRRLIKSWRKAVIGVPRRRVSEVAWCFGNGSPRYHRALPKRSTAPLVRRVSPETGYADKRLHLLAPDGKDGNGAKQTGRQRSSCGRVPRQRVSEVPRCLDCPWPEPETNGS